MCFWRPDLSSNAYHRILFVYVRTEDVQSWMIGDEMGIRQKIEGQSIFAQLLSRQSRSLHEHNEREIIIFCIIIQDP